MGHSRLETEREGGCPWKNTKNGILCGRNNMSEVTEAGKARKCSGNGTREDFSEIQGPSNQEKVARYGRTTSNQVV